MENPVFNREEQIKSLSMILLGLSFNNKTPSQQIELGKVMRKLIWFSMWYPISLWWWPKKLKLLALKVWVGLRFTHFFYYIKYWKFYFKKYAKSR